MEKEIEKNRPKPIILTVLDGWGLGEKTKGNALTEASLSTIKKLDQYYPHISLQASGISVGLPWGEPGNSEVGHMALGTGTIIYQNMPRITMAIQNGKFYQNPVLQKAADNAKIRNSSVHLMGLLGKGSVHSSADHLYALLDFMQKQNLKKVFIHIFTDGRDSSPTSGIESIRALELKLNQKKIGKIATISGRNFAMDRNNNWDRIKKSYDAMVFGIGEKIDNAQKYLSDSYKKEIYDEYIEPAILCEDDKPIGQIADGDSVIFFNYRGDRAKQVTKAFSVPGFSKFNVQNFKDLFFVTMTQYEKDLPVEIAFSPIEVKNCLGKVLSENNLTQFRIAETEKFAHVTYFFNGGSEAPFSGEDREAIPSKDVESFDKAPEMSANEITTKLLSVIEENKHDFILVNFANPDIVGHTGNEKAARVAVETIDKCLKKIIEAVLLKKGQLLITSDHGNVEEMINTRTGQRDTKHSANPVPLWYITSNNHSKEPRDKNVVQASGLLCDVSPTILEIMGIPKPSDMTGENLLPMLK